MSQLDLNAFVIHGMHVSYHNCICNECSQQYFTVFHGESERHTNVSNEKKNYKMVATG